MRGSPKCGLVARLFPRHHEHFWHMQSRACGGSGTDLTWDASGLLEFVEEIGPYPADMKRPTVGRKDHTKGYVRGNYEWQSSFDNNSEMSKRVHTGKMESEATKRNISSSLLGHEVSQEVRTKISNALIGIKVSDVTKKKLSDRRKGKPWTEAKRSSWNSRKAVRIEDLDAIQA